MKNAQYVLEDVESQREILLKESDLYKDAIARDFGKMALDAKKVGTTLLLAGAACAAAYLLTRAVFPGKSPKKDKKVNAVSAELMVAEPKHESEIVRMIKEQITLFLFAIVKEKLTSYLKSLDSNSNK